MPSQGWNNSITNNHLHTLGQSVLSDMGAVYTLGMANQTLVMGNHIHDISHFQYGGMVGTHTTQPLPPDRASLSLASVLSCDARYVAGFVHR